MEYLKIPIILENMKAQVDFQISLLLQNSILSHFTYHKLLTSTAMGKRGHIWIFKHGGS